MERKRCAMCKHEKKVSEFAFVKIQNIYDSYCRECRNAYMRKYLKTYREPCKNRKHKCYTVYKGDEFICMGTADECAKELGVTRRTIYFYNTNTYKKRIIDKPNSIVVEVVEG